jgi:hypothetical protein
MGNFLTPVIDFLRSTRGAVGRLFTPVVDLRMSSAMFNVLEN